MMTVMHLLPTPHAPFILFLMMKIHHWMGVVAAEEEVVAAVVATPGTLHQIPVLYHDPANRPLSFVIRKDGPPLIHRQMRTVIFSTESMN